MPGFVEDIFVFERGRLFPAVSNIHAKLTSYWLKPHIYITDMREYLSSHLTCGKKVKTFIVKNVEVLLCVSVCNYNSSEVLVKLNGWFPVCSGICTWSSPMTTFSHWKTGSSIQRPIRCPSSARAACRTKQHRIRRSQNKTEHHKQQLRQSQTHLRSSCAHSHTNIPNTNLMQVQSLFRSVLWTLNSLPVKDGVVLRCDCKSFRRAIFLLALLFCGQSRQTWLSWKEHLFLSFFPLWGKQYNLQTQMYGRRVDLWATLLERERNV